MDIASIQSVQKSNPDRFERLDFTNVDIEIIDKIFPINEGRYGRLPPPPSYRSSASRLQNWRKLGKNDQISCCAREMLRIASASGFAGI